MAVELTPKGIRVNTVAPTFVETPMTAPMLKDQEFRRFVYSMIPLGKPFVELSGDDQEAMAYTDAAAVLMTERFVVTAIAALDPRPRTIKA